MSDVQFSVDHDHAITRYEMPFCAFVMVFSAGMVAWVSYALPLPHIYGNLSNLIGMLFLLFSFLFLVVFYVRRLSDLLFELRGASLSGGTLELKYRYLGERRVRLPYEGRVNRNVKLFAFRTEKGYRLAHAVSRRPWDRVVIPLQMAGSERLVEMLTESHGIAI